MYKTNHSKILHERKQKDTTNTIEKEDIGGREEVLCKSSPLWPQRDGQWLTSLYQPQRMPGSLKIIFQSPKET